MSMTVRVVLDGARISALEGREPLTIVKTTGLGSDLGGFLAAVDLAEMFFGQVCRSMEWLFRFRERVVRVELGPFLPLPPSL